MSWSSSTLLTDKIFFILQTWFSQTFPQKRIYCYKNITSVVAKMQWSDSSWPIHLISRAKKMPLLDSRRRSHSFATTRLHLVWRKCHYLTPEEKPWEIIISSGKDRMLLPRSKCISSCLSISIKKWPSWVNYTPKNELNLSRPTRIQSLIDWAVQAQEETICS
jgi:hypothetical protein